LYEATIDSADLTAAIAEYNKAIEAIESPKEAAEAWLSMADANMETLTARYKTLDSFKGLLA